LEPRSTGFTNRARLDRLLMLMQLQLNDLADVDAYAVAIRDWLVTNDGRPVGERRAVTDRDKPSLLSKAALDAREEAEKVRAARPRRRANSRSSGVAKLGGKAVPANGPASTPTFGPAV
jgi:hypothetical protein